MIQHRIRSVILLLAVVLPASLMAASADPLANPPMPAFEGQTGAPQAQITAIQQNVLVSGLQFPRALVTLPDGDMVLVDGSGTARILRPDGTWAEPIAGMPEVRAPGGRGFNDFVLDARFADNRLVYMSYPAADGTGKVARARLSNDRRLLEDFRELGDLPGRRLASAPDGSLFITTMGHGELRPQVQDLSTLTGKILRINSDGSIPADNPFVSTAGARPEIWAVGHRDPDGAYFDTLTGELWTIEHGPMGGDELNSIQKGENNGWPVITYGKNYDGSEIGGSLGAGLEQPLYYWFPSVAPSGLLRYTGTMFPDWQGNLLLGTMSPTQGKFLVRLVMQGQRVVAEEHLLVEHDRRVRSLTQAADGTLYVLTDSEDNDHSNRHFPGEVLRLTPR